MIEVGSRRLEVIRPHWCPEREVRVDIIVPVFNGLTFVMDALESVYECSSSVAYRLIVVDDYSDAETAHYLDVMTQRFSSALLLRNSENIGFVHSCIRGYEAATAPFIVLLNSDVVVTPGWLERLLECADSDPRIASVNPLTNHASQIAVSMIPGANFLGMDAMFSERKPDYPDVVTGVGFCMLLRRIALQELGFLDTIFGRGYCEESDLCMRLTTNGYRTVVADNVYVYHKGSASFGPERGSRYLANRRIFDQRWEVEYHRQYRAFRKRNPLKVLRDALPIKRRWDPMPVIWETGREVIGATKSLRLVSAGRAALRGLIRLPTAHRFLPDDGVIRQVTRPGRLRVTYVLHRMVVAGGVLSVIQIVNELIRLGVEARIVTLFEDPLIHSWTRLYTRPIVLGSERELVDHCPESDVVVATLWSTAPWVRSLLDAGRAKVGAYFLQDYEPWFFPETSPAERERVRATFSMLDNRIVKSDWLAHMLENDGFPTRKILIGMDLARFYPRNVPKRGLTVVAMARPRTPRRGFAATIAALTKVKRLRPEVEVILFGDSALSTCGIPFEFRDEGVVADQDRMAEIYSEADVFLDGSDFQGFGRCGLEAMACGAACVLTGVGGVTEYAVDGENSILVPPAKPEVFADAVLGLLDDEEQRVRLVTGGRGTVQRFCHRREARETLAYFSDLIVAGQST